MNDRVITKTRTAALAALLSSLRPDWDQPGVAAALTKARNRTGRLDIYELAIAAIRAAAEPTNRTPAIIPLDGNHWRPPPADDDDRHTKGPTSTPPTMIGLRCARCGLLNSEGAAHRCGRLSEPDEAHRIKTEAVAAIQHPQPDDEEVTP